MTCVGNRFVFVRPPTRVLTGVELRLSRIVAMPVTPGIAESCLVVAAGIDLGPLAARGPNTSWATRVPVESALAPAVPPL